MKPSEETATRVARGRKQLTKRGIGFRPGGDALTAHELRGLCAIAELVREFANCPEENA